MRDPDRKGGTGATTTIFVARPGWRGPGPNRTGQASANASTTFLPGSPARPGRCRRNGEPTARAHALKTQRSTQATGAHTRCNHPLSPVPWSRSSSTGDGWRRARCRPGPPSPTSRQQPGIRLAWRSSARVARLAGGQPSGRHRRHNTAGQRSTKPEASLITRRPPVVPRTTR